jgi:hypothetical protein
MSGSSSLTSSDERQCPVSTRDKRMVVLQCYCAYFATATTCCCVSPISPCVATSSCCYGPWVSRLLIDSIYSLGLGSWVRASRSRCAGSDSGSLSCGVLGHGRCVRKCNCNDCKCKQHSVPRARARARSDVVGAVRCAWVVGCASTQAAYIYIL